MKFIDLRYKSAQADGILSPCVLALYGGFHNTMDDVIVIGSGLAGLSCALELQSRGLRVLVVEARNRCGGRVEGAPTHAGVELGGMWINTDTQTVMSNLCKRFNQPVIRQYDNGKKIIVDVRGVHHLFKGRIPSLSWLVLLNTQIASWWLDVRAWLLSLSATTSSSSSLRSWMQSWFCSTSTQQLVNVACQLMLGKDDADVPLQYLLQYISSNGGMATLTEGADGHQRERLLRGTTSLVQAMAAECNVVFGAHVCRVDVLTVECGDGRRFTVIIKCVAYIDQF
jgi:monoamine oxidase